METTIVYWGNMGIMENETESTVIGYLFWGYNIFRVFSFHEGGEDVGAFTACRMLVISKTWKTPQWFRVWGLGSDPSTLQRKPAANSKFSRTN